MFGSGVKAYAAIAEILDALDAGHINEKEALICLDPEEVSTLYGTAAPVSAGPFLGFVGKPCTGLLAFTAVQVQEIQKRGQRAIFVASDFMQETCSLLPFSSGVLAFDRTMGHANLAAANYGVSAAAILKPGFEYSFDPDGSKPLRIFSAEEEYDFSVSAFDIVTLDRSGLKAGICDQTPEDKLRQRLSGLVDAAIAFNRQGSLAVMFNADGVEHVHAGITCGAAGIGLLRTEHMIRDQAAKLYWQKVVLQGDNRFLRSLERDQAKKFTAMLNEAGQAGLDFPLTIRLIDAPPNEFFNEDQIAELERRVGAANMRGVQLASKIPGLYEAQISAIFQAMANTQWPGTVKIEVPLILSADELLAVKNSVEALATQYGMKGRYEFWTMVETVDAVRDIHRIAPLVHGISIGTGDLTSEVTGLRRGDVAGIQKWMADNQVAKDPFYAPCPAVMARIKESVEGARAANPAIDILVCGQHAADPVAITEFVTLGIKAISVSPNPDHFAAASLFAARAKLCFPEQTLTAHPLPHPARPVCA